MKSINISEVLACGIGIIVGALFTQQLFFSHVDDHHTDTHQITQPHEEYHVHADFLIYVQDEKIDLARDEFMTTSQNTLHEYAHLHDDNGEVKHIHQEGVTFAEFLGSLGIELTEDCLTANNSRYCSDNTNVLALYVNYQPYKKNITEYVPMDDDSVLLYYGAYKPEKITKYMNEVKDDACYYSGTCPERGIAPSESCGLTCDL